ncbi:MAG TPA: ribonucleoside-diphosphate reductase, adenosylcobalamin-dependent, partial [Aequorivita sp.]|nr:ribonucleoside-diphosphate reductase, adenosylcobalamin-dependent [Aequorivita sp.]
KMEQGKVTGANVSVRMDDAFMQAVKDGKNYTQKYPIFSENPKNTKEIEAGKLWKKIVHNAWKSAEPGILFWDTIIKESVPDCYADLGYKTVSTNPCGEIPLCPYDSCRLLAINLFSYVEKPFTKNASFNFELFKKHIGIAQRIMDDIIDL